MHIDHKTGYKLKSKYLYLYLYHRWRKQQIARIEYFILKSRVGAGRSAQGGDSRVFDVWEQPCGTGWFHGVLCLTLFIAHHLLPHPDTLARASCSWNRWRCSWRRSMKTSRKCCAREESWSPNCSAPRTRYFSITLALRFLSVRLSVCDLVCGTSFDWKETAFFGIWELRRLFWRRMGKSRACALTAVLCRSGEPEGCGDGEEAEERPEEDQSPSGWCTDYAGPPEEQRSQQEGDRPAQKSSMPLYWTLHCVSGDGALKPHLNNTFTGWLILIPLHEGESPSSCPTNVCPSPPIRYLLLPSCFSQLEESEFTCAAAVKARKGMEIEIEDLHIQMEDVAKNKISVSFFFNLSATMPECTTCHLTTRDCTMKCQMYKNI